MKKQFLFFAVAALALASCSSENDVVQTSNVVEQTADNDAINFGIYVNRGTTRAGVPGTITNTSIKTSSNPHQVAGFGVFGYYTDNGTYSKYAIPDFMYNQQVTYNTSSNVWEYTPIKYWPNEFGEGAISDDADHVSFFAYAPWVQVDLATGVPLTNKDKNITRLTSNTSSGDPFVKYIVDTNPETSVDLLWGVVPAASNYSTVSGPTPSTVSEGYPYINLLKAQTNSKVNFNLKHALAKLSVSIDAFVDGTDNSIALDSKTRIFVRSITFTGFAMQGALNLNNSDVASGTPNWYEYDGVKPIATGSSAEDVTIYDGRRDGKEATANGEQANEKPQGLNLSIIQNERVFTAGTYAVANNTHDASTCIPSGVTNTPVNLFETSSAADAPIFVIPTDDQMNVTIIYDVETIDPNLSPYLSDGVTHGSTIENRIYKQNIFAGNIEAGKSYVLKLHLGMTSVKFDAEVIDWDADNTQNVDLPHNSPTASVTAGGTHSLTVSASTTGDQELGITGLTGTALAYDGTNSDLGTPALITSAPTVGSFSTTNTPITYSLASENMTVKNQTAKMVFNETGGSATTTTINVTRLAHALGLSVNGNPTTTTITLNSTATGMTDWTTDLKSISITKNSSAMEPVDGTPSGNQFKLNTDGTITLGTNVSAGDEYVITIQEGDAATETVTVVVGDVAANAGPTALGDIAKDATVEKYIYGLTPGSTLVVTKTGEGKDVITATTSTAIVPATGVVKLSITNNNSGTTEPAATVYVTESGAGSTVTAFTLIAKKS